MWIKINFDTQTIKNKITKTWTVFSLFFYTYFVFGAIKKVDISEIAEKRRLNCVFLKLFRKLKPANLYLSGGYPEVIINVTWLSIVRQLLTVL